MTYIFEGKEYAVMSHIKRDWFPNRSHTHVARYVKAGCKSFAEVIAMETKRQAESKAKSKKGSLRSSFNRPTKKP